MIEVKSLTKYFGQNKALDNISFSVPKGSIAGFLGSNGAGKTTTMDIICGCLGADQGEASIAGFDITSSPIEAKKRLGYLPDVPPLHTEMYVEDYIRYAARLKKLSSRDVTLATERALEKLSLGDVKNRIIGNLSKGYRQRVALAQAIVHNPEVLVLDEPTEGLDPQQIVQIRELILSLKGDHTIILSSHILSEVQNISDHIIIINKGRIVTQGRCDELITQLDEADAYQLKVRRGGALLSEQLKQLPFVTFVSVEDGAAASSTATGTSHSSETLHIGLKQNTEPQETLDAMLEQIVQKVFSGQHGLLELRLASHTLEDVFVKMTLNS